MESQKNFLPSIDVFVPPPPPPFSTESSAHFFVGPKSQSNYHQLKATAIIIVLLILAIVFFLSLSLHLLLRLMDRRRATNTTDIEASTAEVPEIQTMEYHHHHQTSNGGGNNNLVDSLPVFSFGSVTSPNNNQRLDCAVCLSPFQSDDRLRLLPYCTHAFHAECIGTWLLTNTTCPLCRSDLTVVPSIDGVGPTLAGDRDETESVKSSVGGPSFRIELGSISGLSGGGGSRRSYSMGSFEYVVPESTMPEVFVAEQEKSYGGVSRPGEAYSDDRVGGYRSESKVVTAGNVGGTSRNWLREYLERVVTSASSSFSMHTASFRSSNDGRSRRSDGIPSAGWEAESHSDRLTAAAENFLLFLRSDI